MNIRQILEQTQVIPVITIQSEEQALPLASCFVENGFEVLEVTLRTPCALNAIKLMREHFPQATIGAGTVITKSQMQQVKSAGAAFAVSPGMTHELIQQAQDLSLPYLPGVATVSEAMQAYTAGCDTLKLFPAEMSGGIDFLKAVEAVLPQVTFCPTGGIHSQNFKPYLQRSNVLCVGGSWLTPKTALANSNWQQVSQICQQTQAKLNLAVV